MKFIAHFVMLFCGYVINCQLHNGFMLSIYIYILFMVNLLELKGNIIMIAPVIVKQAWTL